MEKVLFVCTANICRSPMAQELFNALAEDTGLPFRAESAGTAALEGRPMAENALAALEEAGIYPQEAHSARRVSAAIIEGAVSEPPRSGYLESLRFPGSKTTPSSLPAAVLVSL